jgi:4-hydroxybenzoate polyprenyltransferase
VGDSAHPERVVRHTPVSVALAAVKQLRPKQWFKQVFLLPALAFSGQFLQPGPIVSVAVGVAAFSLLSSSGYILNDWLDREADARHPKKKHRPIASGALPVPAAFVLMALCLSAGVALSWSLSPAFLLVAMIYLVTTLSYSFYFKHVVLWDVLFLSSGFVWRTLAGALAIDVHVSPWLIVCTIFLALFFGFNKRRGELLQVGAHSGTRKNLAEYSPDMLEQFQAIVSSGTIMSYVLYTVQGPTGWMTITIPCVLYGIFRYIYLVDRHGEGGAPDETLLRDRPLLLTGVVYVLLSGGVLVGYQFQWLQPLLK